MTGWNPSNPTVAGDEWRPGQRSAYILSTSLARGPVITASASQTVTAVRTLLGQPVVQTGDTRSAILDIYDLANPVGPDPINLVMAVPASNAGVSAGGTFYKKIGGVEQVPSYDVNAYTYLNEVVSLADPLSTGTNDQILYKGVAPATPAYIRYHAGNADFYDGNDGTAGQIITSRRISSVDVVAILENKSSDGVRFDGELIIGGTNYGSQSGRVVLVHNSVLTRVAFSWYENPATGLPWSNADAVALTDGTNAFGLSIVTKNAAGNLVICTLTLRFRVCTERRVATGHGSPTGANDEWTSFPLLNPATFASASWSKVSGHDYLLLYSTTRISDATTIPLINSANVAAHETDGVPGALPAQVWSLTGSGVPLALALSSPGQIPSVLIVGGVASVDSFPYADCYPFQIGGGNAFTQRISSESAQDYGSATIVVSRGSGGQTAPLVVSLRLASAPTVDISGTAVSIAVADVPADGKYHVVTVRFPTAYTATGAPALLLRATSTDALGWRVPLLMHRSASISSTDATVVLARAQGIGGGTDMANGDASTDLPWSISLAPQPPGTLARSVLTVANGPALGSGRLPLTVSYVHFTWTSPSPALGSAFAYYELQREDLGVWYPIFYGTTEAGHYFNDLESRRNVAVNYRIRSVRTDGGFSSWATFAAVTVPTDDACSLIIATNTSLTTALPFVDLGDQTWDRRRTPKVVDYLARDYPVQWNPTENRGEQFTRTLAVALDDGAVGVTVTAGRAVFNSAVALLEQSTAPYLVYADGDGRKWQVGATISGGMKRTEPSGEYEIVAEFVQVGVTPTPITAAVPPA